MVKHVVCYFLKENTLENRNLVKDTLMSMEGKIPQLKSIEVGLDFVGSARSCDICLITTFSSRAGLAEYVDHPVHVPVKSFMGTVVEKAVSCDFEF